MKCPSLIAVLSISAAAASLAIADPASNDLAARTELHAIETLTLSDTQFLKGDTNGKATTTSGEFRIAAGSGRLPVVVLQHGSGGLGANIEMWERELNAIGVSTFALDGFTGRGLTQVSTDQACLAASTSYSTYIGRSTFWPSTHASIPSVLHSWASHVVVRLRSMLASRASTRCGIGQASSSPLIFHSIPIARPHTSPTPMLQIAQFEFLEVRATISIQSRSARPT